MTGPQHFRKRPVVVEAMQWDGTAEGATPILNWIDDAGGTANYRCVDAVECVANSGNTPHTIAIRTLEGTLTAAPNDWIVRGTVGEFWPVKPEIFAETYEAA